MKTQLPTNQDMQALVDYLPRLYSPGFEPVIEWVGGGKGEDGLYRLPWPKYNPVVEEFYRRLGSECWLDYDYDPEEAYEMIRDKQFVKTASITQIKSMLTFCLRGERFSDGHWAEMIDKGYVRSVLTRIMELMQGPVDAG